MQNQVSGKDENVRKVSPIFNDADDFDLEAFTVKPLSKGLGFHQSKERVQNQLSRQKVSVSPSSTRASAYNKKIVPAATTSSVATVSQNELSAFYGNHRTAESIPAKNEEKLKVSLREASSGERLMAWLVDFVLLLSLCSALIVAFLFLSGIGLDVNRLMTIFTGLELVFFSLAFYSLMNVFYFTILELVSTPGKALMKLKTLGADELPVTAGKTFLRATVSLVSCLAVGLPLLLDFQSHLSETKVFKDDV